MTAVAPQGPIPGAQTPQDPSGSSGLSWEGDKMFNIYIYDYCHKRGFRNTARELLREAEIPSDSTPPINARQGLLFEWWSVFWVLFTAKANGNGTDDAMLYTHHQAHLAAMKQNQNRAPASQPMPMPAGLMQPGQPPIGRPGVNGIGHPPRFAPNGMPNGIPPGNTQPPGPTAFAGPPPPGMQPNGMMSGPPQQNFMGQPPRPPIPGQPRPPNGGGAPFQSPTMAHSPPNPGQQPQPPQGQPQHGGPPPMGQLGPPRGGMLPPGSQPGMNPGQQTPQPYQGLAGRPPSRTATPQGNMMAPSPSMAPRQPMQLDLNAINNELQSMPPHMFSALKAELGLADKNMTTLTAHDKNRIIQLKQRKAGAPGPPNAAAGPSSMQPPQQRRNNKRNSTSPGEDQTQPDDLPRNGSSPPANKRMRRSPMEPPSAIPGYPHPTQPPQAQPGGPGGPGGPPQGMGNAGGMMGVRPMSGPMGGGFPPQGQPGMPPTMQQSMGGPIGMMNMNPMVQNAGMPSSMSPQMHAQPTMMQYRQQLQHNNIQQAAQQQGHRLGVGGGPMNASSPGSDPTFNPGMPPGAGGPGPQPPQQQQPFGVPNNRLAGPPNPKAPMSMLPPPSPAKEQNGPNKDNKGPTNGMPGGSPQNQTLSNAPGTAPPTPGSSSQQPGGQPGPQPGQPGGPPGGGGNMAPSPGLLMNPNVGANSMNSVAMQLPPAPSNNATTDNLFSNDFIQSVASGLDEFVDVGLFRGDGDLNFERDFGQWFNPDDVGMELGKQ